MIKLCAFADEAGKSLEEQVSALKRNNITYIELRSIDGNNVKTFSIEDAIKYQQYLQNNGIKVWSIGSPLGKVDINVDFEEYLLEVRKICILANIFKTNKIRIFSFFNAYNDKEKVFSYLQKMVDVAKEYNVELYHENEKEIYGDTKQRVLEIIKNVKGLKYIYDPANYLQCGESAQDTLDTFHSITDYFHIKDVIKETDEMVPAGHGSGKIDELISKIDKDMVITLEPHLAIFEGYSDIDNTEMKHKFHFEDNQEAFDFAVKSLKELLNKYGYKEIDGGFSKWI